MPDPPRLSQWPQELGRCFSANPSSGYRDLPNREKPFIDLHAPSDAFVTPESETDCLRLLKEANQEHRSLREGDQRLEARIRSYELAARMQLGAPDAIDLRNSIPSTS